jgi:jumonji domain-containing protein 2
LSRTLKEKNITLDGVNSSYLYFGMWRALFAWHTEDCDLYSVNYLHYGAPKFWYAVAPEDRERFEILAQGMVPEMWRACPEFLRHKELLISPTLLEQNGIPFTRMMQKPGEFVVTYPGSYHSGFNCGYNCAESCNFATEAWVEIGEDAGVCECVPDAVSLDMRIFGDLCTRCHSDTEEDESDDESDSDASESEAASERDAARRRGTDTTQKVTAKRKRARGGDATDSDDDEDSKERRARRRGAKPRGDAKRRAVLVPEGWTRSVVMRGARGAPPPAGPGRPRSAAGDRDTYYTSPDGVVVKSKYEVVKYLGSNLTNLTPRDFYFESRPEDAPPARLHVASPATPSPTASADGARRGGERTRADQKAFDQKASSEKASSEKSRRGSGGRDALGLLRSGNAGNNARTEVRPREIKKPPKRDPKPGGSLKLLSNAERAAGLAVGAETFSSWKAGGVLERAVADVMRRAGSMGKFRLSGIRGSSLVMQVEQALGVGSGALRGHGRQIQSLAQANARATPARRRA